MPRPARTLWVTRTYARRRHRTWMLAMLLATAGWGIWWVSLFLQRFLPDFAPSLFVTELLSFVFAVPGALAGFLSLRARKSWVFLSGVAVVANASLFLMPWLAGELLR